MIKTHFQTQIQVLWTYDGKEYFISILGDSSTRKWDHTLV